MDYFRSFLHWFSARIHWLIWILLVLGLFLILAGCSARPVLSYQHLSDPGVEADGYDLFCGGVEVGRRLELSGDVCRNVSPSGGDFVRLGVRWRVLED